VCGGRSPRTTRCQDSTVRSMRCVTATAPHRLEKEICHSFIRGPGLWSSSSHKLYTEAWTTKNIRRQTSCVYVYVHGLPVRDLWTSRRSLFSIHRWSPATHVHTPVRIFVTTICLHIIGGAVQRLDASLFAVLSTYRL
jgi:hypothetical protein